MLSWHILLYLAGIVWLSRFCFLPTLVDESSFAAQSAANQMVPLQSSIGLECDPSLPPPPTAAKSENVTGMFAVCTPADLLKMVCCHTLLVLIMFVGVVFN